MWELTLGWKRAYVDSIGCGDRSFSDTDHTRICEMIAPSP